MLRSFKCIEISLTNESWVQTQFKLYIHSWKCLQPTNGYDSEVVRAFATLFTWSGFSESEEDSTWITEIVTVKTLNNTNTNFQYLVNISTRDII